MIFFFQRNRGISGVFLHAWKTVRRSGQLVGRKKEESYEGESAPHFRGPNRVPKKSSLWVFTIPLPGMGRHVGSSSRRNGGVGLFRSIGQGRGRGSV